MTTKTAPPSKRTLLDEKRRELAETERQHAEAEAAMRTDEQIAASQRVAVLRQHVTRLEAEAADELEAEGRAQAEAWLAAQPKKSTARVKAIAEAQAEAQRLLSEATAAIDREARLRREDARAVNAALVLAARFDLSDAPTLKTAPGQVDHAVGVLKASNALLSASRTAAVRRFSSSGVASEGAEARRRTALRAVHAVLTRQPESVTADALAILKHAPIPAESIAGPSAPAMSEREQRATQAMVETVKDAEATLAITGGGPDRLGRFL